MYNFARYGIWKNGQFPVEWMYSHSVPLSNSVVTGCKPKIVRFLRVQISSNVEKIWFVIPLSHLREQPLHARDCSREHFLLKKNQKRNNLNCGHIIAGLPKLHQFLLVALRSNNSSHYVYHDHVCLRYLKSEAWPPKSRDITWTSSSGESWRGWCAVKIQGIDNLKERLRLCWAHISQHRVAKAIQAFTKRLKGCIARRGGRFELRPKWDEKMMEALVGRGCFVRHILQIK